MKVNAEKFMKALEHMRYSVCVPKDGEIEVSIRQENIEEGKLCECMLLTTTTQREPTSYSRNKTPTTIVTTIEIFAESENRPTRVIRQEIEEIDVES
jgi:hypothetical protein